MFRWCSIVFHIHIFFNYFCPPYGRFLLYIIIHHILLCQLLKFNWKSFRSLESYVTVYNFGFSEYFGPTYYNVLKDLAFMSQIAANNSDVSQYNKGICMYNCTTYIHLKLCENSSISNYYFYY